MKKQVARLQRWLDRFSSACERGKWDSAIIEADCLSAELKEIREDLWNKLENDNTAKLPMFSRHQVFMSAKSLSIALFIVMLSTMPLAVEADRPAERRTAVKFDPSSQESLNWVTDEEMSMLRSLRADLSRANARFNAMAQADAPKKQSSEKTAKVVKTADAKIVVQTEAKQRKHDAELGTEDLLALIQIGEKALRNSSPAIKVIN